MTAMTDIRVGDKVRVVFEDTVVEIEDGVVYFDLEGLDDILAGYKVGDGSTESIEKVVTTFQPGDTVRLKGAFYDHKWTLSTDGYLSHQTGFRHFVDPEPFTSKHYELVTLHESPL